MFWPAEQGALTDRDLGDAAAEVRMKVDARLPVGERHHPILDGVHRGATVLERTTRSGRIRTLVAEPPLSSRSSDDHAPRREGREVLAHGRQRRREVGGIRDIVEAGDGDVPGHVEARLGERREHTEGHLVVRREHGGGNSVGDQLTAGDKAARRAPVSRIRPFGGKLGGVQLVAPCSLPSGRLRRSGRASDEGDVAMAELEEMPHDESGAGSVVQGHRGERGAGRTKVCAHRDDRHVGGDDPRGGQPLALGGDEHDGLCRLVLEVLHRIAERRSRRVGDTRQAHEVAGLASGDLDGDHRARRPVQLGSRREHADDAGSARDERAGRRVAPVAELGDRPADPFLGVRADVRVVVEHPRDGLVGHLGDAGDVVHSWRPWCGRDVTHGDHVPA